MPEELQLEGTATREEAPPVAPSTEATVVAEKPEGTVAGIDWEARAKKAENDLRSLRGSRQRQDDIHLTLQEIRNEQALLRKNQQATTKAVISGEAEGLAAEVAQNETQVGQAREDVLFQQTYNNQWGRMERVVTDRNGEVLPIFDVEAARRNVQAEYGAEAATFTPAQIVLLGTPELQPAVAAWRQAAPQGWQTPRGERDLEGLSRTVADAHEAVRDLQAQRHQQTLAAAKKTQAAALDLSSGHETGGRGPAGEIHGEIKESAITPEFWEAHKSEILRAQAEGRIRVGE